jgi:hypothetical protein
VNIPGAGGNHRALTGIIVAALLAAGCGRAEEAEHTDTTVSLLLYQEQETGIEPYPVRIMVNPEFVRFDDGYTGSDFMLMERATRTIYNVSHEERRILVIANPSVATGMPEDLALTEARVTDTAAPMIAGKQPEHIRFLANGEECYQAVVVPGLLPEATAGLAEFAAILGERQRGDLQSVPADIQTPCFLARYAYAPDRHLQSGLPVQEWDAAGYRRTLADFSAEKAVSAELFELPLDYERFQLDR